MTHVAILAVHVGQAGGILTARPVLRTTLMLLCQGGGEVLDEEVVESSGE